MGNKLKSSLTVTKFTFTPLKQQVIYITTHHKSLHFNQKFYLYPENSHSYKIQ